MGSVQDGVSFQTCIERYTSGCRKRFCLKCDAIIGEHVVNLPQIHMASEVT